MTLAANQSITLDAHKPKKDSVFATGAPTVGVNDCGIWLGTNVPRYRSEVVVGILKTLKAQAKTLTKSGVTKLQVSYLDPKISAIVAGGTPGVNDISIHIGATVAAKSQSHFIDRTLKRLIDVYLEAVKKE